MIAGSDVQVPGDATTGDPPSPAYAVVPPGATRGVVIIHEIYGRQPEIDRVVHRFADAGYAAIAPDLYHKGVLACLRHTMEMMRTGEGPPIRQARRARDWLCAEADLTAEKVGLIGFCYGGGFALAAGRGWAAVSSNYGSIPSTEAMRGIGPVIACYGGRDLVFRNSGDLLRRRLAPLGVTPEVHRYDNVGHSFLTDGDHPIAFCVVNPLMRIRYDAATAEEGWAEILDFFGRTL